MRFVALGITALALSVPMASRATSGGTDRYGCHDSKTAGHHCHGGGNTRAVSEPASMHPPSPSVTRARGAPPSIVPAARIPRPSPAAALPLAPQVEFTEAKAPEPVVSKRTPTRASAVSERAARPVSSAPPINLDDFFKHHDRPAWMNDPSPAPSPLSSGSGRAVSVSGSARSESREILTGPRGGQYYVNSNGKKTYVPRGSR